MRDGPGFSSNTGETSPSFFRSRCDPSEVSRLLWRQLGIPCSETGKAIVKLRRIPLAVIERLSARSS